MGTGGPGCTECSWLVDSSGAHTIETSSPWLAMGKGSGEVRVGDSGPDIGGEGYE